jgi:hypothetical protein
MRTEGYCLHQSRFPYMRLCPRLTRSEGEAHICGEAALLSAANAAGGTRTPDISKRNGPHRWQGFN